ncbi:MAG: hypothetical protein SGPRY_007509 [Prymnesium sp.]
MRERAAQLGCALRPHFKTVKTCEAALIATGGSRRRLVCSTLAEVTFLADDGFDDLLYAVPLTASKWGEVAELHARLEAFHVMIDHHQQLDGLEACASLRPPANKPLSVFVGVDCGYHRDGVNPEEESSVALVRRLANSPLFRFSGLYTHAGHSYNVSGAEAVRELAAEERDVTVRFASQLRAAGLSVPCVGVGSTPTCSLPPAHMEGVDELHPGNYLYYDTTQAAIGSCTEDDVAPRVLTRVVGHYRSSNTLLIDCGWTGASAQGKEHGYGAIEGHPELRIVALKQECGEVTSKDGTPLDYDRFPIDSFLFIVPFHSCATTHQHRHIHLLGDDDETIQSTWTICKGW